MPYKTADKVIAFLVKQYTKMFRKAKNLMSFDEMNVIDLSHEIYDEALVITKQEMERLADTVYKKYREPEPGQPVGSLGIAWVLLLMATYNPVTKYVYENEVERKRSRFAEALVASETVADRNEEIARSLRQLVGMNKQFADDVTFATLLQAYKDNGVERVQWVTYKDDKRCKTCRELDGREYDIDNVPARPHINCRCYVRPVTAKRVRYGK